MSPRIRKLALTAHVTASVGWLGAVLGFATMAVVGLTSADVDTVRAVYRAMQVTGWLVLVPLAVASLVTGIVQGVGTTWGLFQHYWVVAKLVINVFATLVLLLYMQTLGVLREIAARPAFSHEDLELLRTPSPFLHALAALALLVVATTLGVYKPRGLTHYGQRRRAGR